MGSEIFSEKKHVTFGSTAIEKKHHTSPAEVFPNDSEALLLSDNHGNIEFYFSRNGI